MSCQSLMDKSVKKVKVHYSTCTFSPASLNQQITRHVSHHITSHITLHITRRITRHITRHVTRHMTHHITRHITRHIMNELGLIRQGLHSNTSKCVISKSVKMPLNWRLILGGKNYASKLLNTTHYCYLCPNLIQFIHQ